MAYYERFPSFDRVSFVSENLPPEAIGTYFFDALRPAKKYAWDFILKNEKGWEPKKRFPPLCYSVPGGVHSPLVLQRYRKVMICSLRQFRFTPNCPAYGPLLYPFVIPF